MSISIFDSHNPATQIKFWPTLACGLPKKSRLFSHYSNSKTHAFGKILHFRQLYFFLNFPLASLAVTLSNTPIECHKGIDTQLSLIIVMQQAADAALIAYDFQGFLYCLVLVAYVGILLTVAAR